MSDIFDEPESDECEMTSFNADLLCDWPTDILRPSDDLRDRLLQRIAGTAASNSVVPTPIERQRLEWDEVASGISCIQLTLDEAKGNVTMLVRLVPGASYPQHRHAAAEELFLLSGELYIDGRKLQPGDYSLATQGTTDHQVWSETGCTCLLITSLNDELLKS